MKTRFVIILHCAIAASLLFAGAAQAQSSAESKQIVVDGSKAEDTGAQQSDRVKQKDKSPKAIPNPQLDSRTYRDVPTDAESGTENKEQKKKKKKRKNKEEDAEVKK
jgi:hypothetical protein